MPVTRDPNRTAVRITLLAASSIAIFAGATLAPAVPAIRENFKDVPNIDLMARLVLTLPALFIGLLSPFVGLVVDNLGRKRVLVVSILVGALAGISGFFVETLGLLLAGRAILGIAVAGSMTSATTLIADYYEGPARSGFLGLQAGVMGLGGAFVLAVAGIMADISWRPPLCCLSSCKSCMSRNLTSGPERKWRCWEMEQLVPGRRRARIRKLGSLRSKRSPSLMDC